MINSKIKYWRQQADGSSRQLKKYVIKKSVISQTDTKEMLKKRIKEFREKIGWANTSFFSLKN
jgi:hypothetical protein